MFRDVQSWSESSSTSRYTGPITHVPEEWRSLAFLGHPDYDVSDLGRVRSLKFGKVKVLRLGRPSSTMHHWQVGLSKDGVRRSVYVHRLVAMAFLPPAAPGETEVAHNDSNPANNRASNLRWTDREGNRADRRLVGREAAHPLRGRRFTTEEVATIKAQLRAGVGVNAIAAFYGCKHSTISDIRRGRIWRNVK